MKCFIILALFFSFSRVCSGQEMDYSVYHRAINNAERCFFIENQSDSCLAYYDNAFGAFDFVFVKDLVNAAQIAFFSKKPFEKYLIRGFELGLKPEHLERIPLFRPVYNDLYNNKDLQAAYAAGREKYLKRIDFNYLLKVYDLCIQDQVDKSKSEQEYTAIKKDNLKTLLRWIGEKGFPGDKIIGISDRNIFAEIGSPQLDIDTRKLKFSNRLDYYSAEQVSLSSAYIIILMVHDQCTFPQMDSLLKKLVLKGEIHPGEAGLLYDNMFRNVNSKHYSCAIPNASKGLFYLNQFCNYSTLQCTEEQADALRAQWFLGPLRVQKAKKKYEQESGFKLFYGFWGCT
ncbi:MAG TPA: hypothetical protein PLO67_13495 [Saprospiraceae bacterium]|nr:hypothetical protein [Saprospiraceae bacterium]HPI07069.1 hypothetical protein [Saprospiraceae bacterium]